jgi:hypothetical protein
MIYFNPTFGHNFLQVSIGDAVTHVEKHGVQDHAFREVVPFAINRHSRSVAFKNKGQHLPQIKREYFATQPPGRGIP